MQHLLDGFFCGNGGFRYRFLRGRLLFIEEIIFLLLGRHGGRRTLKIFDKIIKIVLRDDAVRNRYSGCGCARGDKILEIRHINL